MNQRKINEAIDKHALWLRREKGGERANLAGVNLDGVNLDGANLDGASLEGASLDGASLAGASLDGAILVGASLEGASLDGASLDGAILVGASLEGASLDGASLAGAILVGASLDGASLDGASLAGVSLDGAILDGAILVGVNLDGAILPHFQIVPDQGAFIGWKKLKGGVVVKLQIPAKAKRTSSLIGRKCRAEYVKVLSEGGVSSRGGKYIKGEIYTPDGYDDDIRVECTKGVHFFITKREAEEY